VSVRRRLDVELTRRRLADSREAARRLIEAGRVTVDGQEATKPARMVLDSAAVVVREEPGDDYASRGAHKLVGALDAFEPQGLRSPAGRHCLDAGASTGGFTDVLLRRGAAAVIAVDVGYGQLIWRLQQDQRVTVIDRCNIRHLTPAQLPFTPDLIVADLSFISLRLVLPALVEIVAPAGDLVLMVKPQFEVGRDALGRGGVVRDPALWDAAVDGVATTAAALGWSQRGRARSPLPGPAGNVEFFLWLQQEHDSVTTDPVG
jgi:23S rRNA (cytidine1920-2'-O)/16S rRNA (cytidine1409-2'-O)-methyltransferase